ncbi:GSCOCG00010189001-RA-CDS [Cotesia congregata]|uniref:Similar to CFAP57: Cilia- and flagella-associated protein 57 (Homo sapiens) n=1 Tax=Cotesia congregata TaxID=51543 RepID=A0A8J2MP69_COTCN|nr:GSCOCG00010189001-RA-CDS [Cotesia congregata]CAG5085230.1 Similar to CFAP57: Cilia- and flagella-associated protein 57 (Homo sapiens) [Cotesia congregata]
MSQIELHTKVFYGLKTDVLNNAHFVTDSDVLYPVGNALAVHNFERQKQRLLHLSDKRNVNIIALTPNKKYVALCETGDKPSISIYDLSQLKRKKSLVIPYDSPGVTKFSCIAFSFDNRYLAAITGEPDSTLLYYLWEKGKVESSLKLPNLDPESYISLISCNPGDVGIVAVAGPHTFKLLTVSETVWRPYGFSKADNLLISSLVWLNTDRLLFGTKDGRLFYLDNGDLKAIFIVKELNVINLKTRDEFVITPSPELSSWPEEIRSLVSYPKGFAFGWGSGSLLVFQKENHHKFIKKQVFKVPNQVSTASGEDLYRINSVNINPSHNQLIVTTGWSQLFSAKLSDDSEDLEEELQIMGQALHQGKISKVSMCAWKSVFMTCGASDRSVRLWDYESESLLMMKQYSEDIFSVSLHPVGLFCLISFTDKLRFMKILIDDLIPAKEFAIRDCRTMSFSQGGHLFAAVNGNVIQVYTTVTFAQRLVLKGHTGVIQEVVWFQSDLKLVTCGYEGAIYVWDISTGSRISETIIKNVKLHGVAVGLGAIFCIATDRKIREIRDSVVREFNMAEDMMSLLVGKQNPLAFITCPGGAILFFNLQDQGKGEIRSYNVHCSEVSDLSLANQEHVVISAAIDGSLCFWRVIGPEKVAVTYTTEVLIGKVDLEDKVLKIEELKRRLKELETENSYKLRQIEVKNCEKLKEINGGYYEAVQELLERIERMKEDRQSELNRINVEILRKKKENEEVIKEMESDYNNKLILEYDKYVALEKARNDMRKDFEDKMAELKERLLGERQQMARKFEEEIFEKTAEIEELQEEITQVLREHEEVKEGIEVDADREIVEVRTEYEALLFEERGASLRLKGEAGVLRNRFEASRRDIDELKRELGSFKGEVEHYQKMIAEAEKDLLDLKSEVRERDGMIQEKERKIAELLRSNSELEKYKFVLNYKIKELKEKIEPREEEIKELKVKIEEMEVELVNLKKRNDRLEIKALELKDKVAGAKKEGEVRVKKVRELEKILEKVRRDLVEAVEICEYKELRNWIKQMFQRYVGEEFRKSVRDGADVVCEFERQREQLERTVESLRKQVYKK